MEPLGKRQKPPLGAASFWPIRFQRARFHTPAHGPSGAAEQRSEAFWHRVGELKALRKLPCHRELKRRKLYLRRGLAFPISFFFSSHSRASRLASASDSRRAESPCRNITFCSGIITGQSALPFER
jgi:hypothetical protein